MDDERTPPRAPAGWDPGGPTLDRGRSTRPEGCTDAATGVSSSRRRVLAGAALVGAGGLAGCLGDTGSGSDGTGDDDPRTVLVFNTGDGTVSVIDVATDEVVETRAVGLSSSFPSNQYTPDLVDSPDDRLWVNAGQGVRALAAGSLSEVGAVDTGSGANWAELTPDGTSLVVSAREPAHKQFRIDADPDSESFGTVTGEIQRVENGDGAGPCDVTIHPDGRYAYVPDLFANTLTVLDLDGFSVATRVEVPPEGSGPSSPWMGTVSPDGSTLLVEHSEGETGTESVWRLDDPAAPTEATRLTAADGLGERPLTSEIGPDSETGYVFTPGSESLTLVDLSAGSVAGQLDLGGEAFAGTWDPDREKLYVPVQTEDEVAVVGHDSRRVEARIEVGPAPYGATAARVRPSPVDRQLASDDLSNVGSYDTTYCIGNCACGHEL